MDQREGGGCMFCLTRSSNTPDRLNSRTASYRKRVEDARSRDIKPDVQDDSVVYDQSKSSQGLRMRPRTRRGESFNVKKTSRNRSDQEQQWQTTSKESGPRFYENQQPSYKNPLNASLRKLAPAKSSPSLNKIEIQVPTENQVKALSGAKSSPNLNNEHESEGYGHVNRKHGECYNNNYERYSLDGPTGINASWNLGSGDFKRSYVDQPSARMNDITDSYEKEGKSKKNTRRSLPPYMLQKYQADYENISDYGTTPLRSEKISEIDDLDSDEDVSNIHIPQTTQLESLVSPQSPPIPPVRDPSSLKYIKINQTHEKYPSWPVTKSNGGAEPPQPINTRAQSWTDTNTNTNKDFPVNKAKLAYTPGLRPLPERNSPNAERREDGKSRAGSDPGLKSEFVYDKYGRVQQRDYNKVDQNQIKKFYEQKPGYPPPKLDSDGHNLGDEKYNVPSPPERDVPGVEERERFDENTVINKSVTRPTSFTTQVRDPTRDPTRNKLNYSVQNTIGSMSSPIDVKGGQPPFRDSKPEKLMVDSCTSPQHSPKDSKSNGNSRPRNVEPSPSSQLKSTTKAYIVKQTPYYNTSTQTDQSPPSNPHMQITIPKPMPRKTVSDNAAQTSPTSTEKNVFSEKISPNNVRPDKRDYNQKEKRSNYSDINSLTTRHESDNHSAKHSGNYADFSALQANYADISNLKSIHERYSSDIAEDDNTSNNIPHYSEYTASQAPILRELSKEFYKGRMPGNYDKRVISPNELLRSSESMQPGMKEAESYSSVIIHASESAGPFGRDDFGSRSSLSDSRQDIYSVISESTSSRSSIAKGRRSLDPGMLSHRPRPLNETRYNSSSLVNHARTVSSPTSDYRRPRRSSEASTPSQPKSSPDSRSSGSTYYSSSDTSQSRLHDISHDRHDNVHDRHDISHDRHESIPDSVFSETRSPLPPETELKSPKSDSKDKNLNMNLGRKPSMKKAYGIYDETERVLRGAAATLKAVNEAQNLRRSGENYVAPMPRLSRGSSESKILDQIQEENDVFIDSEGQRSRSSSGKEDGSKTSDKTKRELFSGEYETQRKSGMKRSSSEQIHKYVPNSLVDQPEKTRESTPNLATQTDTLLPASRSNLTLDIQKRNSESDLKKIQQQAVLNFMEIKTGKRMNSSGSQEATTPTGDPKDLMSPTQSVQDLISKTSENLANRTQRTDSFRRSGSSSSSRNSQDYMEMNRPRKETEWSKMRSQGVLSYGSNRSSLCSENTYEDINVFSPTLPRSSLTEKPTDDLEVS
ncbi:hypothetical protein LOTGIDRAFT_168883 [Lottia gigantea]|uniref:Uncharacterized protein n=1 Tax=Lottia gigantea TaxID=225164 RepID=V4B5N0_LOTGI|nr:hypothetical protein LOTGIDRAFT_168883 [Lottia gigantea]ESO83839.1 hypothetical protein LOTGIDRAFT_168883 [Lottia gigantea]